MPPAAPRDAARGFCADRADRRDPETFLTGRQAERARDRERGVRGHAKLKAEDAAWFAGAVDALTTSRAKVGEAMAFCYDHVAAAEAVSAILKGALVAAEPTLALGKRVARLYLASDVLRNSSLPVKGAQAYRAALQACLPEALLRLNAARLATTSRMASAAFEDRVAATLAAWLRWSVFPPAWKSNLQPDFNVRVCEWFDTSTSAVLRELAKSDRPVQKSAESTSM